MSSNNLNSDQFDLNFSFIEASNASYQDEEEFNCSYQDEEESEKAASQAEIDDSLTLVADGSQEDLQKDVDDEEASTGNSSGRMVKMITMKSASRQSNTGQKRIRKEGLS